MKETVDWPSLGLVTWPKAMSEAAAGVAAKARRRRDLRHRNSPPPPKKNPEQSSGFCLVEAAGFEPASENTSSQTTTCVSPFSYRNRLETEPSAPVASPDISHGHASGRNVATSLLNDDQS